jgi:hypothetical protein
MDLQKIYEQETGEEATWRYDREDLYTVEYVEWLEQRLESKNPLETLVSSRLYTEDEVKEIYEFASTCHLPTGHGMSWEECKKQKGY